MNRVQLTITATNTSPMWCAIGRHDFNAGVAGGECVPILAIVDKDGLPDQAGTVCNDCGREHDSFLTEVAERALAHMRRQWALEAIEDYGAEQAEDRGTTAVRIPPAGTWHEVDKEGRAVEPSYFEPEDDDSPPRPLRGEEDLLGPSPLDEPDS